MKRILYTIIFITVAVTALAVAATPFLLIEGAIVTIVMLTMISNWFYKIFKKKR